MKECTVLIIDDHPAMRQGLIRLMLAEPGMKVFAEAGNRMDALGKIGKGRPDMIIIDLELGDTSPSGFDLIKEMRTLLGAIPVLVFTMHDEVFFRDRAFSVGANGFVSKKGSVAELLAALHAVCQGKIYGKVQAELEGFPDPAKLSSREFEVFKLLGQGKSTKAITGILNIGEKTVESHKYNIRLKMNFSSMEELRQYAINWQCGDTK